MAHNHADHGMPEHGGHEERMGGGDMGGDMPAMSHMMSMSVSTSHLLFGPKSLSFPPFFQFHFGTSETVLFSSWHFITVGGLIGSMVGIFFMAALYEGLKYYRWKNARNERRELIRVLFL